VPLAFRPTPRLTAALLTICAFAAEATLPARQQPPPAQTDLDALMAKVLERREVNRKALEQYILAETERFEVLGPGRLPLYRFKREYEWFIRDGMHVRSPVRFDGVPIDEPRRRAFEDDWILRERRRRQREADGEETAKREITISVSGPGTPRPRPQPPKPPPPEEKPDMSAIGQPRFVSEAYFMDFKFEPGNYYLAGRSTLEGREVLEVEYYPTRMFSDDEERKRPERSARQPDAGTRERTREQEIERQMNKTSLVTLWVDPAAHQIVKFDFENVWLDFLPAGWMVRVGDLKASMVMGQPFDGVWLPRVMSIHAGVTLASGSYEASYEREFSNYRQGDVKSRIKSIKKDPR
jgi:hypothetical protein